MSQNVKPTGTRRPEFQTLEERLSWARETTPLTQQELADHLGISRKTVQNYESGVGHPKANRLVLWANACDVDYGWLAGSFYDLPADTDAPTRRPTKPPTRGYAGPTRRRDARRAVSCAVPSAA